MKRLCLFTWAALLLHACQTTPVKSNGSNLKNSTKYAYAITDTSQWTTAPQHNHISNALNVLKAYELGDTARLRSYLADTITVYYDGGEYKGGNRELMYALKEKLKLLSKLRIKVNSCETAQNKATQQERTIICYTQYYINNEQHADSTDLIDEALFKDNKITVWRSYARRYGHSGGRGLR